MEYDFLKDCWKDKLILHKGGYITLSKIEVSKIDKPTLSILEEIGLPVILPSELLISFLPFTHFSFLKTDNKEFVLIGDFSPDLSGKVFLGVDVLDKKGEVYEISKDHQDKLSYNFVNKSLYQFLMFLAHYNRILEKDKQRIAENLPETLEQLKLEYEELKNTFNEIDNKPLQIQGTYWWWIIDEMRAQVMVREWEESDKNV